MVSSAIAESLPPPPPAHSDLPTADKMTESYIKSLVQAAVASATAANAPAAPKQPAVSLQSILQRAKSNKD